MCVCVFVCAYYVACSTYARQRLPHFTPLQPCHSHANTGDAVGKLFQVDRLTPESVEQLASQHTGGMLLLVVREADGDEELGPLVPLGLRGVVLCQELPHLSHLGVRARQVRCCTGVCAC